MDTIEEKEQKSENNPIDAEENNNIELKQENLQELGDGKNADYFDNADKFDS